MASIVRLRHHLSSLFRDQFFYLCLIAIYDSFRFYKDLPYFISEKSIIQGLWFPQDWFFAIKEGLTWFSLALLFLSSVLIFLPIRAKISRLMLFAGYLLASFIHFHYWELHHRSHLLMYCLLIMAFYSEEDEREKCLDLMQGITLSIYTLAGIWKLYHLAPIFLGTDGLKNLLEVFPMHISHFFMRNFEYNQLGVILIDSPFLSLFLFLSAMVLQLGSIFIYGKKKLYPIWGVSILLFHFGTYFLMNIWFWQMMWVILLLFVVPFRTQMKNS